MARILMVLVVLAAGSAVGAALFAHGSQAAPPAPKIVLPSLGPASVPGPAALQEATTTIQRTFVSTGGDDVNPCTRAQPCRNFAAAIANTTAGGEVVALDSGGYGVFSIDKSITIAGAPGAHVAVTAFAGTAITVAIDAPDTVVLRNLYLTGLGGDTGILFQTGGRLFVDSVVASGFGLKGLDATADNGSLFVHDSVFRNNQLGFVVEAGLRVEIADSRAERNNDLGFWLHNGARGSITGSSAARNVSYGFDFDAGALFAVSDSVSDGNGSAGIVVSDTDTAVTLSRVVLSNNIGLGGLVLMVDQPVARIGGSTVTGNGAGLWQLAGTLESFGDNMVRGNATNTQGTITTVSKT